MSDKRNEVTQKLSNCEPVEAMKLALESAPLASKDKDQAAKEEFASTVGLVIYKTTQTADIKNLITQLDSKQNDLIMGCVFRLMDMGKNDKVNSFSSNVLFRWHKVLVEEFGKGIIVRHMSPMDWV